MFQDVRGTLSSSLQDISLELVTAPCMVLELQQCKPHEPIEIELICRTIEAFDIVGLITMTEKPPMCIVEITLLVRCS